MPKVANVGALIVRLGFGGMVYYTYNKNPPPPQKKKKQKKGFVVIQAPQIEMATLTVQFLLIFAVAKLEWEEKSERAKPAAG